MFGKSTKFGQIEIKIGNVIVLEKLAPPLAKAPENILPVIMGKHQNVIRMANFMKFHLVISYHIFFLAEMTHKELLAFFASGAKGVLIGTNRGL